MPTGRGAPLTVERAEDLPPESLISVLPELNKDAMALIFRILEKSADISIAPRVIELSDHEDWWVRLNLTKLMTRFEDETVHTRLIEFRDRNGELVAGLLADWSHDGASAVYSFFDPALSRRSLGSHMVLWLTEECQRRGLPYVYLGYWIEGSRKMSYKERFRPLEALSPDGWRNLLSDCERD